MSSIDCRVIATNGPPWIPIWVQGMTIDADRLHILDVHVLVCMHLWGRFVQHIWNTKNTKMWLKHCLTNNLMHFGYRFLHLSSQGIGDIQYVVANILSYRFTLSLSSSFVNHRKRFFTSSPGWPKRRQCLVSSWRQVTLKVLMTLGDRLIDDWSAEESWSLWMLSV